MDERPIVPPALRSQVHVISAEAPFSTEVGDFSIFYRGSFAALHRIARRICRDPELAKDLVQDTCIRMLRAYDGDAEKLRLPFAAYILGQVAIDEWRKEKTRRKVLNKLEELYVDDAMADPSEQVMANADLVWQLEGIPPRQQEALFFRFSGLPMSEVAALMGISPNTAHGHYRNGLQRLRNSYFET